MPIEDAHLAPNPEFYLVPARLPVQFRLQAVGELLQLVLLLSCSDRPEEKKVFALG